MEKNMYGPKHRTSSHPGLISSTADSGAGQDWETVAQKSYVPPRYDTRSPEGARARLMERFFWQQISEDVFQEWTKPSPVEEYKTEYEDHFNDEEFRPSIENISKESELHRKYPLYGDSALSFWKHLGSHCQGATKVINPSHPFRKNGQFSKPLADILDEPPTGFQ